MDYVVQVEGEWRPTKDAFRGGKPRRISVDRAKKCNNDPKHTQKGIDPVCRLIVGSVYSINVGAKMTSDNKVIHRYKVCVESTPKPCNDAHADIYAHPEKATKNAFRLLQEGLAGLAQWEPGFEPKDMGV